MLCKCVDESQDIENNEAVFPVGSLVGFLLPFVSSEYRSLIFKVREPPTEIVS